MYKSGGVYVPGNYCLDVYHMHVKYIKSSIVHKLERRYLKITLFEDDKKETSVYKASILFEGKKETIV